MSTFLGVNYDKWHGIGAFGGSIIAFLILYWLIPWDSNPALQVLIPIVLSALTMFGFQLANESYQKEHWEGNYRSYEAFEANSRRDWKFFWYGIFAGQFINGLLGGLIL